MCKYGEKNIKHNAKITTIFSRNLDNSYECFYIFINIPLIYQL